MMMRAPCQQRHLVHLFDEDHPACIDDDARRCPHHLRFDNLTHLFDEGHPTCVDDTHRHPHSDGPAHLFDEGHPACVDDAHHCPCHPRSNGLAHLFDEGHPACDDDDTHHPCRRLAASSTSSTRATPSATTLMHVTHVIVWPLHSPL